MEVKIVWQDDMAFTAMLDGFEFMIDAPMTGDKKQRGPKPKGLTLVSLAGCTGMDVIALLKKMRVAVSGMEIKTKAQLADEHPMRFTSIEIQYWLSGDGIPEDKVKKAVKLSRERYCGVSASLNHEIQLSHKIIINGKEIN